MLSMACREIKKENGIEIEVSIIQFRRIGDEVSYRINQVIDDIYKFTTTDYLTIEDDIKYIFRNLGEKSFFIAEDGTTASMVLNDMDLPCQILKYKEGGRENTLIKHIKYLPQTTFEMLPKNKPLSVCASTKELIRQLSNIEITEKPFVSSIVKSDIDMGLANAYLLGLAYLDGEAERVK